MAKGVTIIEQEERTPVMDKNYYANGFEFISKDDAGLPIFKLFGNDLKVLIKFTTINDGEEGPAMSLFPSEFVALVPLFGAGDFMPTKENRELGAVLLEGQQKANASGKTVVVESKDGWVPSYSVTGLHPPEGQYEVRFLEAFSPKHERGSLEFSEGANDNFYMLLRFGIAKDGQGKDTVWEGFPITVFLNNAFLDSHDSNGEIRSAEELGMPVFAPGKNGLRWQIFGKYFAPGLLENYDWQVNPSKSEWGVCEATKPQYVIINRALKEKKVVKVYYQKKEKSADFWFDLLDSPKMNPEPAVEQGRTATQADFVAFVKARKWDYAEEIPVLFESEAPIQFTPEGIEWAKKYLGGEVGPWAAAGLDLDNKKFELLSPEQLGSLMDAMEATHA